MRYRVPRRVAYVLEDSAGPATAPRVYLMRVPDGTPLALSGTAALIWIMAANGESDVPGAVSELVGEAVTTIEGEVHEYLEVLLRQGLLERAI